jgi:integrase
MTTNMAVEDFYAYIKQSKSRSTFKEYKAGIDKFSEWFKKTPDEILEMRRQDWVSGDLHQKRRFGFELEKFHKWLLDGKYSVNSARTLCLGLRQLFKFFEMPLTLVSSEISKTVPTVKDIIPTIEQYRKMFTVADNLRDKLIVSMGKDLGWRIGDFVKIRKDRLPSLDQDAPIEFALITEKEDVIAKSFISGETANLLREYLPTLPPENPYLFPSNAKNFIDPDTINRNLRSLAERAGVHIPAEKRLRFHAFRKRFLTECANLHIDVNTAKILVGKDVEESMLAYLSEVEHRAAFIKLHQRMRLVLSDTALAVSAQATTELGAELQRLKRVVAGVVALGGSDLVDRAQRFVDGLDKGTFRISKKELSLMEKLELIGKAEEQKQAEEYRRLIESENGNNKK